MLTLMKLSVMHKNHIDTPKDEVKLRDERSDLVNYTI